MYPVYYGPRSRPSGRRLARALHRAGYCGQAINFGYPRLSDAINSPQAIRLASNKRLALEHLRNSGVSVPDNASDFPCVARPDRHRGGSGFYLCRTPVELENALYSGCTHVTDYLEGGREFRIHVAFGKPIKLAEKIGGGIIKNFTHGCYFAYPQDFNRKISLRRIAKSAVTSIGLDFGAVDVVYLDSQFYVLEVNSAPSLTSRSDTLERYVRAFMEREL